PEMDAGGNAANAEIPLRDHDALHAEGRQTRSRHDVSYLHDTGEPGFLLGIGHAPQDAGVAETAAACHRALCQFSVHRGTAEWLCLLARRDLARYGQSTFGPAPFRFRAGF